MSVLRVEYLVKKYNDQVAVDQISFAIDTGEIVGFLGPNGAGKTTTMKMIAGITSPDTGAIFIHEQRVYPNDVEYKKSIAYLPEQNPLYTDLYIKEALEFNAQLHGLKNINSLLNDAIQVCGLEKEKNKKINQLSKGLRQRVGLATSLLHKPDLFVLDEATTGLDPNQILDIRALLKSLGTHHAILISTHIMQEVESMCKRCIVINNGQIIADDNMDALKQKSIGIPTVKVKFDNIVSLELLKSKWKNVIPLSDNLFSISYDDPKLSQSIFKWAVENRFVIEELKKEDHNIEDVFKILTHKDLNQS